MKMVVLKKAVFTPWAPTKAWSYEVNCRSHVAEMVAFARAVIDQALLDCVERNDEEGDRLGKSPGSDQSWTGENMMILHVGPLGGEGQKLAVGMLTLHSVPGFVPSKYKGNGC